MDEIIMLSNVGHVQRQEPLSIESTNSDRCTDWKERSDTAYLAGFLAIGSIFTRFSLAPLIWQIFRVWHHYPLMFDLNRPSEAFASTLFTLAIPLPELPAPFVLWFGIKACCDLKRNPHKSGAVQAILAVLIGSIATPIFLSEVFQVVFTLMLR